jgi:ADP-ribose diphosphatase
MPVPENVMHEKPAVLAREIVARSRLFAVEELQLRFSNGVERTYERLVGKAGYGAVMVVAMADAEHALLVEEYCAGTDDYQLSLPKGLIEPGEEVLDAANRELKEEAGFGAERLEYLTELSLSPGYMNQRIRVVLARDLYEERLPGDEPEPMAVSRVNLRELSSLVAHPQFSEGRALAALYLTRDLLIQRGELVL